MAGLIKGIGQIVLLSVVIGGFLSLVDAFGTGAMAPLPRTVLFMLLSLACGLVAAAVVTAIRRVPTMHRRPAARRIVTAVILAPVTAVVAWLVVGLVVYGAPQLRILPLYFIPALGFTVVMSALSYFIWRPRPAATATAILEPPRFLQRLPLKLRGAELYALEAEDHYLRIRTDRGSDLILMRLSDAVAELEGADGARTHRSWWVARAAVTAAERTSSGAVLTLRDGARAQVSRQNLRGLREAGWF